MSGYLLDTHVIMWLAKGSPLSERANALIDSGAPLYFSVASLWEMTIKSGMGWPDFLVDLPAFRSDAMNAGYLERNLLQAATDPEGALCSPTQSRRAELRSESSCLPEAISAMAHHSGSHAQRYIDAPPSTLPDWAGLSPQPLVIRGFSTGRRDRSYQLILIHLSSGFEPTVFFGRWSAGRRSPSGTPLNSRGRSVLFVLRSQGTTQDIPMS